MAEFFQRKGVSSGVVHSKNSESPLKLDRKLALGKLDNKSIRVLFSVDLFNEGVDAPLVDTVLFLRPTDSYNVFLQQLGRGLRKAAGKTALTVLDFIGNYRRAHHIPLLLAGKNPMAPSEKAFSMPYQIELPEVCIANFDFRLIDLFAKLRLKDHLPGRIRDEILRLQRELSRRPTRVDVLSGSDIPFREFRKYGEHGWLELLGDTKAWKAWDDERLARHAWDNPVHFLSKTEHEFFAQDSERKVFFLQPALKPFLSAALAEHVSDILELRTLDYFARRLRGNAKENTCSFTTNLFATESRKSLRKMERPAKLEQLKTRPS